MLCSCYEQTSTNLDVQASCHISYDICLIILFYIQFAQSIDSKNSVSASSLLKLRYIILIWLMVSLQSEFEFNHTREVFSMY